MNARGLAVRRLYVDQRLRRLARVIGLLRDAVEVGLHGAAERGERNRGLALEQGAAQLPLERADRVGQRRLRDAAASRRAREIAFRAQRQEVADLVHLHVFNPRGSIARGPCHRGRLLTVNYVTEIQVRDPEPRPQSRIKCAREAAQLAVGRAGARNMGRQLRGRTDANRAGCARRNWVARTRREEWNALPPGFGYRSTRVRRFTRDNHQVGAKSPEMCDSPW